MPAVLPPAVPVDVPPIRIRLARRFFDRMLGLHRWPGLQDDEGLLIVPCNAIHTIGMRFAIDVVFLSADGVVMRVVADLKPWRFRTCLTATSVLELRAGCARMFGITPGTRLLLPVEGASARPNPHPNLQQNSPPHSFFIASRIPSPIAPAVQRAALIVRS